MDDRIQWAELDRLFDHVLDLDTASRKAYLDHLGEEDPSLCAKLLPLIHAYEASDTFLESPLVDNALLGWWNRFGIDRQLNPIGPYSPVREIGRGGMCVVYLAYRDEASASEPVALKVSREVVVSKLSLSRFESEKRILMTLDHPNITRLVAAGLTHDGRTYLAMEYVDGIPVTLFCDERRLSIFQRSEIFLSVCHAIDYAHTKGVIHLDIKPDNVLVGHHAVPKILDFGISMMMQRGSTEETTSAPVNKALTPDYASPEQMRGEPLTFASDIYSLGVLLYRLFSGYHPFRRRSQAIDLSSLNDFPQPLASAQAHGECEQDKTSAISPWERCGTIREKLLLEFTLFDGVIRKALDPQPERRYSTVADFARDVGKIASLCERT